MREHYPLPTIEEVCTRMTGAKVFSVLDARNGFWQVKLDKESSFLTTFNTPCGRYRWLKMPFGIKSAPEVWQRKMHEIVEGLKGVEVIADDFLIYGCGPDLMSADSDHDRNLEKFLERAEKESLKLNAEKCKFKVDNVTFIGHKLSAEGLQADPNKVRAIVEMPRPQDAAGIRRFIGMVSYLAKFVPNLSVILEPLRKLICKETKFEWLKEHEDVFETAKRVISEAPVLKIFDSTLPVTIQCDSSDKGMGAVLLQEGHIVHAVSRSLTQTEMRYAQIEKEMLAICFACEKFYTYIYGKKDVIVESDHQPLETIFRKCIFAETFECHFVRMAGSKRRCGRRGKSIF